ncbi:MAG TPA: transposase [Elusimicrobiota bacterium]|nr:transposase [Elusimicrobiota bacterium]
MPRPPRIQFEHATYHLFSRGNRRERLFLNEADYAIFEKMMLEAMRWTGIALFNWSQMPNHVHFHVETPAGNLAEFAQRLFARYAQYFNRVHRFVGHVFQGRYGARLVNHEAHFQEIVRYVELNPYRLKKRKLAALGAWKWSSWRYYLLPEDQWPEGSRKAFRRVLERFGPDPATSRKNLARFLADGLASGTWEDFYKVRDNRFVGDEAFVEKAKQQNQEPVRRTARSLRSGIRLQELLQTVQDLSGLPAEALSAKNKTRSVSRWRQALSWVARRLCRIPLVQLAEALQRAEPTVSLMVARYDPLAAQAAETQALLRALRSDAPEP